MPAIDRAINGRITYNQTELKYVLQQLHRHRRENWKISQDASKAKADKRRKGTNSRRAEVVNLTVTHIGITVIKISLLFYYLEKRTTKARY